MCAAAATAFSCGSPKRDFMKADTGVAGSNANAGSESAAAGSNDMGASAGVTGLGGSAGDLGQGGDAGEGKAPTPCDAACDAANAQARCSAGACEIDGCDTGYFDCDGSYSNGCEAKDPPIGQSPSAYYPTRGTYTGSIFAPSSFKVLRPALRWTSVAPTGCGELHYELEMDDSCQPGVLDGCGFTSPEVHETSLLASTFTPAADLPVSRKPPVGALYAWRVRACDASRRCSGWSSTSYLNVGRLKADLNGDGYGDIVLGSDVYLGSSQFDVTSDGALSASPSSTFGAAYLGDVNGDGYGDLGATVTYAPTSGVAPVVFFGAATVAAFKTVVVSKASGGPSAYIYTTSAGDLNGDGFADVSVTWNYQMPVAQVRVFYGAESLPTNPGLVIDSKLSGTFPFGRAGGVGDLNRDGYGDLMVPTGWANSNTDPFNGSFDLYQGGVQPDNQLDASVSERSNACAIFAEVWPAGDLDADGFEDAVSVCNGARVSLYAGAAKPTNAFALVLADTSYAAAASGWDFDGDRVSDFLVARTSAVALTFLGKPLAFQGVAGVATQLSADQVSVSDHDGDGRPDVVALFSGSARWAGSDGTLTPKPLYIGANFGTLAR